MRGLVFLVFAVTLAGCSGMMMSGSSGAGSTAESERAARVQASKDAGITQHVRQLFRSDAVLRESSLYVDTNKGIVTLTGSVPTYEAREDAEKLAISVNDVVSVRNRISVVFSN